MEALLPILPSHEAQLQIHFRTFLIPVSALTVSDALVRVSQTRSNNCPFIPYHHHTTPSNQFLTE